MGGRHDETRARLAEIEAALDQLGLRMEPGLNSLDEEGDPIMDKSTGDFAEDGKLTPEVLALAEEWSALLKLLPSVEINESGLALIAEKPAVGTVKQWSGDTMVLVGPKGERSLRAFAGLFVAESGGLGDYYGADQRIEHLNVADAEARARAQFVRFINWSADDAFGPAGFDAPAAPAKRRSPALRFTMGTGDLWLCLTDDGMGLTMEQKADRTWYWTAKRAWWHGIGDGWAPCREDAVDGALAMLVKAGLDVEQLPADRWPAKPMALTLSDGQDAPDVLADAIASVATEASPNTINLQSYDADGKPAGMATMSSPDVRGDVAVMTSALELVHAIRRGVAIESHPLYKLLVGKDAPGVPARSYDNKAFEAAKAAAKGGASFLADGVYWYTKPGCEPEPVVINFDRYQAAIKGFDGRIQTWLRGSEQLVGPVEPLAASQRLLVAEGAAWKWGYEHLQGRMESLDRHGWAHDCDAEIAARIAAATAIAVDGPKEKSRHADLVQLLDLTAGMVTGRVGEDGVQAWWDTVRRVEGAMFDAYLDARNEAKGKSGGVGCVLALPEVTLAEANELIESLTQGGNVVKRVGGRPAVEALLAASLNDVADFDLELP